MARTEEDKSYAVGHFSLGYILGKASTTVTKTEIHIPTILMLSVMPDTDIIMNKVIPQIEHRGPTHSTIILFLSFMPIFALYRKKAIPYFLALIQHPLLADYVAGAQIQLLWPFTTQYYGIEIDIKSATNVSLEWMLFLVFTAILLKSKNVTTFFKPYKSSLILSVPTFSVLLPVFLSFPLEVPIWLIPPHLFFIFMFLISLIIDVHKILFR
ncbi:metal-dependent hydrolase [Candidatus Bathyarchaeota archaeon]|nr:metal-dependent hydrolase [Candidatus Bathyarchaeota archaeon]